MNQITKQLKYSHDILNDFFGCKIFTFYNHVTFNKTSID